MSPLWFNRTFVFPILLALFQMRQFSLEITVYATQLGVGGAPLTDRHTT